MPSRLWQCNNQSHDDNINSLSSIHTTHLFKVFVFISLYHSHFQYYFLSHRRVSLLLSSSDQYLPEIHTIFTLQREKLALFLWRNSSLTMSWSESLQKMLAWVDMEGYWHCWLLMGPWDYILGNSASNSYYSLEVFLVLHFSP